MKKKLLAGLITFVLISTGDCFAQNKYIVIDEPSSNLTKVNLNDTIIDCWQCLSYFYIDLDKNGIDDLRFTYFNIRAGADLINIHTSVMTSDNCQFFSGFGKGISVDRTTKDTSYFTASIAKILNPSDTLHSDSCNTTDYREFVRHYTPPIRPMIYINEWISGEHFFGIKKTINNKEYLGWVKLEFTSYKRVLFKEYAIQTLPIGIDEESQSETLIYPNPSSGIFTIGNVLCRKIEIYNSAGGLILSQENKNNISNLPVDISHWNSGIYILKAFEQGKEGYFVKKIIKE